MVEPVHKRLLNPVFFTFLVSTAMLAAVLVSAGGDPFELIQVGTRFSQADPDGTEGYDGQFVYYIALDPDPESVAPLIDDPPYRYQRILLPMLARLLSLGNQEALPWILPAIVLLSHILGTAAVVRLLEIHGVSRWYGLTYGLWVGFLLAIRLSLPETLAYACIAAAILAQEKRWSFLSWLLYLLGLLAKEVVLLFVFAQLLFYLWNREWKSALGLALVAIAPFALFQAWLWSVFGGPGFGLGGEGVTGIELIPYMGLWRIGYTSLAALLVFSLIFVPSIVYPSAWSIYHGLRQIVRQKADLYAISLALNGVSIAILTHSTFREPGGLLRFACGLVLAVLFYAARSKKKRVLNYSLLWLVMNVILLN